MSEQRLVAEHAVTPNGIVDDVVIEIAEGRIQALTAAEDGQDLARIAGWAVPGFIDPHVHGGGGFDYATEDPDEARRARRYHLTRGTTTSFASLVTASIDGLCRQITMLADLVDEGVFAGIHLEGPFLSAARCGAHDPALLQDPTPETVQRLLDAGRGTVKMVTLAPELPGAIEATKQFIDAGVQVAVGHTDGGYDEAALAVEAGATVATHLFNAMHPIHHRTPGPVPLLLDDDRVTVELIADGFHLHAAVVKMAVEASGADRAMLITDAMIAAGAPDGEYQLGGLKVRVVDAQARLINSDDSLGSIAGSTLTMAEAFRRATASIGDIAVVAALAATNAADRFGLEGVGRLEPGARADLCLVNETGELQRVMQGGEWVAG